MSYALEFAPDAMSQWRELDVGLQEAVLGALEVIAAASLVPLAGFHDIALEVSAVRHYVFIRYVLEGTKLSVLGVAHFARRLK